MKYLITAGLICMLVACKSSNNQPIEDELYSRHLQRKVKLTILRTPGSPDKTEYHLLLVNDGQDLASMHMKDILDSLYNAKLIRPLVVVGIHAGDRMQEYGVVDRPDFAGRGSRAGFYDAFINNELYPYCKKKMSIRKFQSVTIAGWSLGALSAFDIAWNHSDKIDKAGIFSPSFWWRDKDISDSSYSDQANRIAYAKIRSSRKKPKLSWWFFSGSLEETSDRDKDGIIDVQDDAEDLRLLLIEKGLTTKDQSPFIIDRLGKHDQYTWARQMPAFLMWAVGNH